VPNPKCDEGAGCGPWSPPMKKNDAYKGKWTAPFIDNPAYKGVWAPKKIKNPDYFEDKTPAKFEPIGAIGFEIWTMQNDILFDNIYIGHSEEDAAKLKAESFDLKIVAEKAEEEASAPKPVDPPQAPSDLVFKDDPVLYVKEKFNLFVEIAKRDPIEAIKFVPEAGAAIGVLVLTLFAILASIVGGGAAAAPSKEQVKAAADKAKKAAVSAKDKTAEAVTTGTEKAQAEINKRSTRSTAQ